MVIWKPYIWSLLCYIWQSIWQIVQLTAQWWKADASHLYRNRFVINIFWLWTVAPDAIYSHVKTYKEEAKNMHYAAPEYAGIYQ